MSTEVAITEEFAWIIVAYSAPAAVSYLAALFGQIGHRVQFTYFITT